MIDEDAIGYRWDRVGSKLDERGRRMFAAGEVRTAGRGGLAVVSRITGLARSTINRGAAPPRPPTASYAATGDPLSGSKWLQRENT
jgi:hypothetical protein